MESIGKADALTFDSGIPADGSVQDRRESLPAVQTEFAEASGSCNVFFGRLEKLKQTPQASQENTMTFERSRHDRANSQRFILTNPSRQG